MALTCPIQDLLANIPGSSRNLPYSLREFELMPWFRVLSWGSGWCWGLRIGYGLRFTDEGMTYTDTTDYSATSEYRRPGNMRRMFVILVMLGTPSCILGPILGQARMIMQPRL